MSCPAAGIRTPFAGDAAQIGASTRRAAGNGRKSGESDWSKNKRKRIRRRNGAYAARISVGNQ